MSRRLRAFRRWMRSHSVYSSDALDLVEDPVNGISIRALCNLREGDVVAAIPKAACLTIRNSAAREAIEESGLAGALGLAVAVMYERSMGAASEWDGYLQVLPEQEEVPLVWGLEEVDKLLAGTELHKTLKEDKAALYEDWKEYIEPLIHSGPLKVDPECFGVEQYFSAKSLVASRSFDIDEYHGFGMVPLADLFNHKTGAENVHFTSASSSSDSDDEGDGIVTDASGNDQSSDVNFNATSADSGDDSAAQEDSDGDPDTLEMIVVRNVEAGNEVFNTYGSMGNAALLHRYGFTELDNPFDIVNIDLNMVLDWSCSSFSDRHSRSRLLLWRKLEFSGSESQNSEYFEVSYDGEPQLELLVLLYVILLPPNMYEELSCMIGSFRDTNEISNVVKLMEITRSKSNRELSDVKESLLTWSVCSALVELANMRESFYGSSSAKDDAKKLKECCHLKEKKLYHSLVLRVSERKILTKLRAYASRWSKSRKRKHKS